MKYVYLMKAGTKQYKVGIAKDVHKRQKALQTSNAKKVEIVTFQATPEAYKVEQEIHKMLFDYRHDGGTEWFSLSAMQVIKICMLIHKSSTLAMSEVEELNEMIKFQNERQKELHSELQKVFNESLSIVNRMEDLLERAKIEAKPFTPKIEKPEAPVAPKVDKGKQERELYYQAVKIVKEGQKASTSLLQMRLRIGYGRAARLMQDLEFRGIVSRADGYSPRKVLVKA